MSEGRNVFITGSTGLARAIWPQPWVQGLPERIQGAVCQHGKTYGTAQDGQDEGDHPTGT